jgi:two-component system, chemotaxis family, CheB/CheR fusion protein
MADEAHPTPENSERAQLLEEIRRLHLSLRSARLENARLEAQSTQDTTEIHAIAAAIPVEAETASTELERRVQERTRALAHANVALRASELRFRTLVEGMPQLVWRSRPGGVWTWASPQWCTYTGLSLQESLGDGWLAALHPDDRDPARERWRVATPGDTLDVESRIYSSAEDRYRHFRTRASCAVSEDPREVEWLGTSTDIDDMLRLQQQQGVLVAELQHRVRNILAVVRAVFSRTVSAGGALEDVAEHFKGRLDALARTQVIVARTARGTVDLESLIRDELLSVGAGDRPTLCIDGPEVALGSQPAIAIGLAVHELTMNALKYGALKFPGSNLNIRWHTNMDNRGRKKLNLVWEENGVPAVSVNPTREGFGRELIEQALPYRLGAETRLDFRGGGIRCSISLLLSD